MKDMYAVKFRHKKSNEWQYANHNIIVPERDIDKFQPEAYLCSTLSEARSIRLLMIDRYKDNWDEEQQLAQIKISKMNRYNLRMESEVLEYREFK